MKGTLCCPPGSDTADGTANSVAPDYRAFVAACPYARSGCGRRTPPRNGVDLELMPL
jgi:hypothetical protein